MTGQAQTGASPGTVAVVGGGLAGITAALRCADAGAHVTLFEARPRLGGLTHSFRRGELEVDNGQHVFMRCCTAYRDLLDRLGVADDVRLQPRLDIPVRMPGASPEPTIENAARLRRDGLPAPLHMARALLGYRPLSVKERLSFVAAALQLRGVDRDSAESDACTFGAWLRAHHQSARAIDDLWDLVGVATLNARADDASLSLAATVFQIGMLSESSAADIGWSRVPLGALHGTAAMRALTTAGVDVRTGAAGKVDGLSEGGGWRLHTSDGEHRADQVVLAVPPPAAESLLPAGALDADPGWSRRLGSSPIVNVHLVFDRRVMDEPFLAGVRSPVQWIFDRTEQSGLVDGQYVALSMSAADSLIDLRTAEIRERLLPAVLDLLPAARGAVLRDFFVTRERHATFRPAPGTAALRPSARTGAAGLYVAGAWTDTGWPATMEGAVRSGDSAAEVVLRQAVPHQSVADQVIV